MANPTSLLRISGADDLQQAVDRSFEGPVVVFKHSATCPVSAWARDEMVLLARSGSYPVYELVVQAARPLSNSVAQRYAIQHESPQAIVLHRDQPTFHASHRRVTASTIREAASKAEAQNASPAPSLPA